MLNQHQSEHITLISAELNGRQCILALALDQLASTLHDINVDSQAKIAEVHRTEMLMIHSELRDLKKQNTGLVELN